MFKGAVERFGWRSGYMLWIEYVFSVRKGTGRGEMDCGWGGCLMM